MKEILYGFKVDGQLFTAASLKQAQMEAFRLTGKIGTPIVQIHREVAVNYQNKKSDRYVVAALLGAAYMIVAVGFIYEYGVLDWLWRTIGGLGIACVMFAIAWACVAVADYGYGLMLDNGDKK